MKEILSSVERTYYCIDMSNVFIKILFLILFCLKGLALFSQDSSEQGSEESLIQQILSAPVPSYSLHLIKYYNSDNQDRYYEYRDKHPDIHDDELVWKVNANLDYPFYENIKEIKDLDQFPLLVNKYNKLPDNYQPRELVKLYNGLLVTPETKLAFDSLRNAAKKKGYTIEAKSAYRSITYQKNLYARYVERDGKRLADTYSARPGHSEHHTGRAIDVANSVGSINKFGDTKEAAWVVLNAWKYGFIVRYTENNKNITGYKSEPWHLTYIGDKASRIMFEENISSLEEYVIRYMSDIE